MSVVSNRAQVRSAASSTGRIRALLGAAAGSSTTLEQRYNDRLAAFTRVTRELQLAASIKITPMTSSSRISTKCSTPRCATRSLTPTKVQTCRTPPTRPSKGAPATLQRGYGDRVFYERQMQWKKNRERLIEVERQRKQKSQDAVVEYVKRFAGRQVRSASATRTTRGGGVGDIERIFENLNRVRRILDTPN